MKQLKTTYKELNVKGIYELMAMNTKGEYANINTNNGTIVYYKKVTHMPMPTSKITVLEFEKEISKGQVK